MKKRILPLLLSAVLLLALSGCEKDTLLDKKDPVTVSFWHVYGEQSGSPMDLLVQEFNRHRGPGTGGPGAGDQPVQRLQDRRLFKGGPERRRPAGDARPVHLPHRRRHRPGEDDLVDWRDWFTQEELADFVPGFLQDGTAEDGKLLLFPISKSTQLVMCNGSGFARFSQATRRGLRRPCHLGGLLQHRRSLLSLVRRALLRPGLSLRAVELRALELGSGDLYTQDGWYDTGNALFKESWMQFARALAQGHVMVSDLYSNTQVMTGEVLSGLGSSAAILYYNDTVTYRDGTQEPMDLHVLPMPMTAGHEALMTQAGVGLCAYKTTDQKAEAAALFVRWLTQPERNLDFVAQTGYMPVRSGAFDDIAHYDRFPQPEESYRQLYAALKTMREGYTPLSEPRFEGYYGRVTALYDGLRQLQQELPRRAAAGEDVEALAEETWALLCSIR